MPFDRLVRTVDEWAGRRRRTDVFAQIGTTQWRPSHVRWTEFLGKPDAFRSHVAEADAIVAHAGMGSILSALELGKPILVMPRRGDLRETRNDHQIATAKRFLAQGRIFVAFDEEHLLQKLDHLEELRPCGRIASCADPRLLQTVASFVRGELAIDSWVKAFPSERLCDTDKPAPVLAEQQMVVAENLPVP